MPTRSGDVLKVLNDLISTCRDRQEGYAKAAKGAHGDDLANTLTMYSRQADTSASELQACVTKLGAQPAESGHAGGVLHSGWVDLEQRIRPKDDPAIIAECQRGDAGTLKHYQRALKQDLPEDVRKVVQRHMSDVERCIDKLKTLEKVKRAGGGGSAPV